MRRCRRVRSPWMAPRPRARRPSCPGRGCPRISDPEHDRGHHRRVTIPVMPMRASCTSWRADPAGLGRGLRRRSEVAAPADYANHSTVAVHRGRSWCGCDQPWARRLRRITEGVAMIRSQVGAVPVTCQCDHAHACHRRGISVGFVLSAERGRLFFAAKETAGALRPGGRRWRGRASCRLNDVHRGCIATPADAAMMMQLGAEGVSSVRASASPQPR